MVVTSFYVEQSEKKRWKVLDMEIEVLLNHVGTEVSPMNLI